MCNRTWGQGTLVPKRTHCINDLSVIRWYSLDRLGSGEGREFDPPRLHHVLHNCQSQREKLLLTMLIPVWCSERCPKLGSCAWHHGWQAIRIKTASASSISDKLFWPTCAGSSTSLKSTFRCELATGTRPHALRCRNFATSPWSKPSTGWTGHNFVARYLVIAPDKWRVF